MAVPRVVPQYQASPEHRFHDNRPLAHRGSLAHHRLVSRLSDHKVRLRVQRPDLVLPTPQCSAKGLPPRKVQVLARVNQCNNDHQGSL